MTKKILKIGVSMCAVFALCALAAVPALAADEFLVGGATFTGELNGEAEGSVKLINYAGAGSTERLTEITCSGIADGTIAGGANGKGTTLNVLSLEMVTVGTLNSGDTEKTGQNCEVTFDAGSTLDCQTGTLATAWAIGVNQQLEEWATGEILLNGTVLTGMASGTNNLGEAVGTEIECTLLDGLKITNECTGGAGEATLTNDSATSPPSVLAVAAGVTAANRASCSLTGEHSGEAVGEGNSWVIGTELERLETAVN